MKIKAEDMRGPLTVTIVGNEPWLRLIYESFDLNPPSPSQLLTGSLQISPTGYGLFYIKGVVQFAPNVDCSRCDKSISWEISRDIDVRFLQVTEQEEDEVERDLEPSDMDAYYVDPQGFIDLEIVINDFVQTSLPNRLVKFAPQSSACAICHIDLSEASTQGVAEPLTESPFAILKSLKLPTK